MITERLLSEGPFLNEPLLIRMYCKSTESVY